MMAPIEQPEWVECLNARLNASLEEMRASYVVELAPAFITHHPDKPQPPDFVPIRQGWPSNAWGSIVGFDLVDPEANWQRRQCR